MARVSTAEARDHFSELLNRTAFGKERIVVTRRGKNLIALIPLEDLALLEELEDRIDLEEARKALEEAEKEGTEAWEDVKAELGL